MNTSMTPSAHIANASFAAFRRPSIATHLQQWLMGTDFIQNLSRLFSAIMEEEVTPRQTLCLLNAVTAFTLTVFPLGITFVLRLLLLAWFGLSLLQCRRAGMGR